MVFPSSSTLSSSKKTTRFEKTIYNTRNTGIGNGMRGMHQMREIFTLIPGNLLGDSGDFCGHFNITGNIQADSRECLKRLQGIFGMSQVLFSEPTRHSARLRDPTLLRGFR